MNNDLHRTQLGKGTTGSDFDLTLVVPGWGRDVHFKTHNTALFAENRFQVARKPVSKYWRKNRNGRNKYERTIIYYPENKIPVSMRHHFPLFGGNISYKPKEEHGSIRWRFTSLSSYAF